MLDKNYWTQRYVENNTPWDIGYACPAILKYFEQVEDKNQKILIPGAGNAYEAEALNRLGFKNVYVLDLSEEPLQNFKNRYPDFPEKNLILGNFFDHDERYDFIVEQTFFCAIHPSQRVKYAHKIEELLLPEGKLVGVLFNDELNRDKPPFGGDKLEYKQLFARYKQLKMEDNIHAIGPRAGRELFILLQKTT
ncbi:MAG: methyltransferase domain-containing protein [Luteibaculum sp.]